MTVANVSPFACIVRRTLAAPVRMVYRVWTEPAYAKQWSWGAAFTTLAVDIDCRVGGLWRQQVRDTTTGDVWTFEGAFREVVPNRRLVHLPLVQRRGRRPRHVAGDGRVSRPG
ncbi:MAG: ATPase [Gemmatimonadetes bacterium]|nr:ATPase [Gemmatimonadota bacterium]